MSGYLLPVALGAALVTGTMAEKNPYDSEAQGHPAVVAYGGAFNAFSDKDQSDRRRTGMGGAEYRFSHLGYGIRPVIGGLADFEGDTYGYGGLVIEVPLIADRVWFIPGAAVGAYAQGDGRDLGGTMEFRTSAEIAYRFDNNKRLGVAISHLSNAGIYNDNPGTEMITVNVSLPLSSIW